MQVLYARRNTVFKTMPLDSLQLPTGQKVNIAQGQSFVIQSARLEGRHYRVQLQQDLAPVGQSGYFYADHVQIATETPSPAPALNHRGVWLTNVDSQVLTSRDQIKAALDRLAELNFNTLYPVVWNRGYTLYPSRVAEQATGAAVMPQSPFQGRDMLAELLHEANAYGFRVIPWFEYGLMAPPASAIAHRHPDWLTQTIRGGTIQDGMVWFNPAHPDVRQFIVALIRELVDHYEVAGIQLDDHFGMPVELGYDSYTRILYQQEHRGLTPPAAPTTPSWMAWRGQKVTQLMAEIFHGVKASQPRCLLSLSPNPQGFSWSKYLADWQRWERDGLIEELVVQLYRDRLQEFAADLSKPEMVAARSHIPVSIGILAGLKSKPVSFEQMQQQVATVRKGGFAGISFFFYETVVNQKLAPQAEIGDREPLKFKNLFA